MAIITGTNSNDLDLNGTNGSDTISGLDGNDTLRDFAGNDMVYGGDGTDVIEAGLGDDLYDGGAGAIDFVLYSQAALASGVNVDLTTGTATGGGGKDRLVDIEHVEGSAFGDTLRGSAFDNFLIGDQGDDTLRGEGGNDHLYGGTGNDQIFGGDGDDFLNGGAGTNVLSGGLGKNVYQGEDGVDTVSYASLNVAMTIDLAFGSGFGIGVSDFYFDVENVIGSSTDDTINGSLGGSRLDGGGGNDFISGRDSADTLLGGAGRDSLLGGDGSDLLIGSAGRDSLLGGTGPDRFQFLATSDSVVGANLDVIADFFRSENDLIDVSAIDAKANVHGNQAFTFLGAGPFTASGQIRAFDSADGLHTVIQLNTDADAAPEMEIFSNLRTSFAASDFIL